MTVVHNGLQIQEASFYHDGHFSFMPKWNKCMNALEDRVGTVILELNKSTIVNIILTDNLFV
jgi:hypothetical protein